MSQTNPATRLHGLLDDFNRSAKLQGRGNQKPRVREVIGDVLDVEPSDTATVLAKTAKIVGLPAEVRQAVALHPEYDVERLLPQLLKIETAFARMNIDQQWEAFAKPIDEASMTGLDSLAVILEVAAPEADLAEHVDRVLAWLESFRSQVRADPEIDDDLRDFLELSLSELEAAIRDYRITGSRAIERALNGEIGAILRRTHRDGPESSTGPVNPWLLKLVAFLQALDLLLRVTTGSASLPSDLRDIGALPGPPAEQYEEICAEILPAEDDVVITDGTADPADEVD